MMLNLNAYKIVTVRTWGGMPHTYVEYKNVPKNSLEDAKRILKGKGLTYRVRYRGTRTSLFDTRPRHRRMQDCLKRFADRVTIYIQG
jgi:hypothetical protein